MKNSYKLPAIEGGSPQRKNYLVYGQPIISDNDINEVVKTLKTNWIGTGPRVKEFEEIIAKHKGVKHAIGLNSCTAGLHLALLALNITSDDDVLVPTMTFCASVNVIEHIGAKPIFLDCDINSMNITFDEIIKKITPKTKAIILVHFAGRMVEDTEKIVQFAKEKGIFVIEDCAHAIETTLNNKNAGTIGDIGVLSFYVTKNITTSEGGMLITNNTDFANRAKIMALHGMDKDAWKRFSDDGYKHYDVVSPGYKYNMTDIQASLGISQFSNLDTFHKKREEVWNKYFDKLKKLPISLPNITKSNEVHAYHLFQILIDTEKVSINRDQLLTALHKENIGTGVHYRAAHLQSFYSNKYKISPTDFPNSNYISDRTLSLPLSQYSSEKDIKDVCDALTKILSYYASNEYLSAN